MSEPWSCADVERELFVLLRGELALPEETRARAHIGSCRTCENTVLRWNTWRDPLERAMSVPLPPERASELVDSIMAIEVETPVQPLRHRWSHLHGVAPRIAIAAAAVLVTVWVVWPKEKENISAPVVQVLGSIAEGSEISSDGLLGQASIVLGDSAVVRVEQAQSRSPVLRLERGSIELDVAPIALGAELRACTRITCVRVIGTHFSLTQGRADTVRVAHGVVAVSPADAPDAEVILRDGESFVTPWQLPAQKAVQAASQKPELSAEKWMHLAEAALQKGDARGARDAFDEVQRRFPTSPLAAEAAYAAATTAAGKDAAARFKRYIELHPRGDFVPDALWQLGTSALALKHNDEAAHWLSRLLGASTSSSRRAEAAFLLAGLREASDPTSAEQLYERVLQEEASPDLRAKARARLDDLQDR